MKERQQRVGGGGWTSLRGLRLGGWVGAWLLAAGLVQGQIVEVGELARPFTVINRATQAPVSLTNFLGQVVLLDFFAYWCGPCQQSSPDVEQNIKEYYAARGGNAHGVPVAVVPVNIEEGSESATDQFIANAGLSFVVNDYAGSAYDQFQTGYIPLFVIINGVSDSPSHLLWEVLYRDSGYPGAPALRDIIDSVEASDPTAPPRILQAPAAQLLAVGDILRLQVQAAGASPLRYQWFKNQVAVPNATNAVFQRIFAQTTDSGRYAVEVANGFGTNRSSGVDVRVAQPAPPRTFAYLGGPVNIPDGNMTGIASTLTVQDPLEVLVLKLSLRITHPFRGDLRVSLRAPSGREVTLCDFSGDDGDHYVLTGQRLAGFGGEAAQGVWTLRVMDGYTSDEGRLESWSLEIVPPELSLASAYAAWIQGFSVVSEAQRAPGADPDGDGIPNLLEYLLEGHSPTVPALGPGLAVAASAPEYLEYEVRWRSGVDASGCAVWLCENLAGGVWWQAADRGSDIVVDRSVSGRLAVRARRSLPALFLQLRVAASGF